MKHKFSVNSPFNQGTTSHVANPQVVHSIEVLGFELESLRVAAASIATAIQSEHTFVEEDSDPPDTGMRQLRQQEQQLQQQEQQHAAALRASGASVDTLTGVKSAGLCVSSEGEGQVAAMSSAFQKLLAPEQSTVLDMGASTTSPDQAASLASATAPAVPCTSAAAAAAPADLMQEAGSSADAAKQTRGPEIGGLLAAAMRAAGGGNWALRGGGGGSRGDEHDEHRRRQFAATAMRRCALKLEGRDIERGVVVTVGAQVEHLVRQAVSPENLCQMYEGWTPWI